MNVRTALISSALLLAVLGWACEQQGPASPSALSTPGGVSLGAASGVSLDGGGGVRLAVDCDKKPDNPNCNGGDGGDGGGKKTFVAEIILGDKTPVGDKGYDPSKTVISAEPPFPVDNQCNSGNSVPMTQITAGGIRLNQLALEVKQCHTNYHVSVKVSVGDDEGKNWFATDYLPVFRITAVADDSVTLRVHNGKEDIAEFFRLDDGTFAFMLNIADIKYTFVR